MQQWRSFRSSYLFRFFPMLNSPEDDSGWGGYEVLQNKKPYAAFVIAVGPGSSGICDRTTAVGAYGGFRRNFFSAF